MKAIIGLGNPGLKFRSNRHNVGFLVVKSLARKFNIRLRRRECSCLLGKGRIGGYEVVLALPLTYMNLSGQAVSAVVKRHKVGSKDLLVICDDVSLPVGKIRIRPRGSAGGHKGLRSIITELGSDDFSRLRVGIGLPPRQDREVELKTYVLADFKKGELKEIDKAVATAVETTQVWTTEDIVSAMNRYN